MRKYIGLLLLFLISSNICLATVSHFDLNCSESTNTSESIEEEGIEEEVTLEDFFVALHSNSVDGSHYSNPGISQLQELPLEVVTPPPEHS